MTDPTETAYPADSAPAGPAVVSSPSSGQIYLYGEIHGNAKILDKEFALWSGYYNKGHMRDLFIEYPYYTAQFLNIWMQSDNDDILNAVYSDWEGAQAYDPAVKEFSRGSRTNVPRQCSTVPTLATSMTRPGSVIWLIW